MMSPDEQNRLHGEAPNLDGIKWLRSVRLVDGQPASADDAIPTPHVVMELGGGLTDLMVGRDEVEILCGPEQATTISFVVPMDSIAFGADWAITVGDFRILAPFGLSDPESKYHWYAVDDHWARIVALVEEVGITRPASVPSEKERR